MWKQVLDTILTEMHQFGLQPQPPCDMDKQKELLTDVVQTFDVRLPSEYLELLSVVDGIDWNGLVIFGSQRQLITGHRDRYIEGILDRNLAYRDNPEMANYLILGEDGVVLFGLKCDSGHYVTSTIVGLNVLEAYPTCSDLLSSALKAHL